MLQRCTPLLVYHDFNYTVGPYVNHLPSKIEVVGSLRRITAAWPKALTCCPTGLKDLLSVYDSVKLVGRIHVAVAVAWPPVAGLATPTAELDAALVVNTTAPDV